MSPVLQVRDAVRNLAASRIREVANAGMGRDGVLPFWFGEPDTVTPEAVRAAAMASLQAGETFYSQNLGLPELREALARYSQRLHGLGAPERIAVTNSGMSALAIANQALLSPGDRVVAVGPLWPNITEGPRILGAEVSVMPLDFGLNGWELDLQRLLDVLTPAVRLLIVNSPGNPTGWTMRPEQHEAVLAHCRRHGIWILADDAYERLYFGTDDSPVVDGKMAAPCFLDVADPDDRLITVNTFSKTWQMTGWRLGWLQAPSALMADLGKLIEFNTSCAPVFVQRAGIVAIEQGESAVADFVARLRRGRDVLIGGLQTMSGVRVVHPDAAMYAFFAVDGVRDSLEFCKRLVSEHGLGLAPGVAFGAGGEGFLRWCFAASEERLGEGLKRFARGLAQR